MPMDGGFHRLSRHRLLASLALTTIYSFAYLVFAQTPISQRSNGVVAG